MNRDTESRQPPQQQPQPQPAPQPPAEPQQDDNANPFRHFLRDIDIAAAVARRNLPQQQAAELDYEINEDGIIEGGVAVPVPASVAHYLSDDHVGGGSGGGLRRSTECDLVLFIECSEDLKLRPNSIAKRGSTISIGLEKTTKLNVVFTRFVEFITEKSRDKEPLSVTDLEFTHNEILSGKDTAEGSALMKDDRIKVRRQRQHLRDEKLERQLMQRESDRVYFKQIRSLVTNMTSPDGDFDVAFDCKGLINTTRTLPCTLVKAHSAIIQRRCKWLGDKIRKAKEEKRQNIYYGLPTDEKSEDAPRPDIVPRMISQTTHTIEKEGSSRMSDIPDDVMQVDDTSRQSVDISPSSRVAISDFVGDGVSFDAVECVDDDDAVRPCPLGRGNTEHISSGAAEVVAEDDDLSVEGTNVVVCEDRQISSPFRNVLSRKSQANDRSTTNMPWVTLDHNPRAIRLLLEYCGTNRCVPLGHDAFFQSSKGAVSPFTGFGKPTVSLPLALATIRLAEEANMPRFSLMCEVAASSLITKTTVVDALSFCSKQEIKSGNRLPILRKSVISLILHRPVINELANTSRFVEALSKQSGDVIPSLLLGAKDIVPKKLKRKRSSNAEFKRIDADERVARNIERHVQRGKRNKPSNYGDGGIARSNNFLFELKSLTEKSSSGN